MFSRITAAGLLFISLGLADTIGGTTGSQIDLSDVSGLWGPGEFLFTGNSMYDFLGSQELDLLFSEGADPETFDTLLFSNAGPVLTGSGSLTSYQTPVQSNANPTPEPRPILLFGAGGLAFLFVRRAQSVRQG